LVIEVARFGQFMVLQINCDVLKLQEYLFWYHFGDVIKLRHLNTSSKWRHKNFPFSSPPPPLSKILVAPLLVPTANSHICKLYRYFASLCM